MHPFPLSQCPPLSPLQDPSSPVPSGSTHAAKVPGPRLWSRHPHHHAPPTHPRLVRRLPSLIGRALPILLPTPDRGSLETPLLLRGVTERDRRSLRPNPVTMVGKRQHFRGEQSDHPLTLG